MTEDKKIRIGNDIRLLVGLKDKAPITAANVKQIKAYFVNTSIDDVYENVQRFPKDPQSKFFRPGERNLNRCGVPGWNVWPEYHGFGYNPFRNHAWPHRFDWNRYEEPGFAHKSPFDPIDLHLDEDFQYLAHTKQVNGEGLIEVFFPAQDQLFCGDYKLIVTLVVYEAGWGRHNLHTYTIDYGKVFSLVDTEDGAAGDIVYNVNTGNEIDKTIGRIIPEADTFVVYEGEQLVYGDVDINGNKLQVTCTVNGGDYVIYTPDSWNYDTLVFESDDESIATISRDGKVMYSGSYIYKNNHVVIRVYDANNHNILGKFTVEIRQRNIHGALAEAQFATAVAVSELNDADFMPVDATGFTLANDNANNYLWIKSARKLKYLISGTVDGGEAFKIQVPLKDYGYDSTHDAYYYRSQVKIVPDDHQFYIIYNKADDNE